MFILSILLLPDVSPWREHHSEPPSDISNVKQNVLVIGQGLVGLGHTRRTV